MGDIQVLSKVGGNSVAVAKNAIGLSSRKWSTTAGILDSSIALDSTTGVAVTGVNIGLNSIMSTVMGDSLGAKVICDGGSTTVSGNSISLASNTRLDAGFNVARFLTAFSMELTNVLAHQLDKESLGEAKDENGKTKKAEMNAVEKWSNIGAYALPAFVDLASWGTNQVISVLNTGIKTRKPVTDHDRYSAVQKDSCNRGQINNRSGKVQSAHAMDAAGSCRRLLQNYTYGYCPYIFDWHKTEPDGNSLRNDADKNEESPQCQTVSVRRFVDGQRLEY